MNREEASAHGFVLRDEDGSAMKFTGVEDFEWHLLQFKERIKLDGHESVTRDDEDLVPLRPTDAYARRDGLFGYGQVQPNDDRSIEKYISQMQAFGRSCSYVVKAWLRTMDDKIIEAIDQRIGDVNTTTRANWFEVVRLTRETYAGWTSTKGTRNFVAMELIEPFTSVDSTRKSLKAMKKLMRERNGWNLAQAMLHDDTYYRPWLLQRMKDWPALHFLKNTFSHDPNLTFDQMRLGVHNELRIMDEENQAVGSTLNQAYMARILGTNKPLTSSRYVSDSTGLQLDANAVLTQQIMTAVREEMSAFVAPISPGYTREELSRQTQCFNCHQIGHISSVCPHQRRHSQKYGNITEQSSNKPSYIPHPNAYLPLNVGNKRIFRPFDPALSRYPERGTGLRVDQRLRPVANDWERTMSTQELIDLQNEDEGLVEEDA